MMQIPEKLQTRGIRFVLIEKGGKRPFQMGWQNKTIEYDDSELLSHMKNGGNYGVMGGGEKNLIIIDFDNEKVQEEVSKKLPDTFTVKTGSGMFHKYFFSDKVESFKIFDEDMNTLADIQGEGKQVVGAGSIHPNGTKYELVSDEEIAFLPYAEIQALLMPYDKKPKKKKKIYEKPKIDLSDDFLDKVKSSLSMSDVLDSFGVDTSRNPCACPFHSSKGGKCLGFNDDTAHCFHCDGSWNIFSFTKDMKRCDFKGTLEYLSDLAGLQDELEESRKRYIESLRERERIELENNNKDLDSLRLEVFNCLLMRKRTEATELITQYILKHNYIYSTRDDIKSELWIYRDGIYTPNGKTYIKEICREILQDAFTPTICNDIISKIEVDNYINQDDLFQNNNIEEIPVMNGILNIITRELNPFDPKKIFFNKLPVNFNPDAKCPEIDKFLSEVLAKEEDREVFYEMGGCSLLKEYRFEKAFMFVGNGRNGKDKSLELIKRLLGVDNCCSVPLSSIVSDSFIISQFHNKMVNLSGEINNQDLKDTSMFKALTGRSLISAQRKFLNPITFVNYAKFIFACNELPMVYDNSRGFWDRWVLLEFPYTFVSQEEYDNAKDKTFLKLKDENIIERITTPQEMEGLLIKFLDGLRKILVVREFSLTKGTDEIKKMWMMKSNSVMAFLLAHVEEDYSSVIPKKEFRKRYSDYCKVNKINTKSDFVIKRTLEETFGAGETYKEFLGVFERLWEGIKWKN